MIAYAFTCPGPYAVLIMLGIKRAENRSMIPEQRVGRCAISCKKSFNAAEYGHFIQWAATHLTEEDVSRIPSWGEVRDWPGKIVGCCDYVANTKPAHCHDRPREIWDDGRSYWWDLSNVVCFDRPIACRGNVGMWQMDANLAARVSAADVLASCVGERIASESEAVDVFLKAIPVAGGNEGFFVLPLDDSRCVLSEPVLVSLGDPSTTVIRPSEVFAAALKLDAKFIILAHNHPSGNPTPSIQDRQLTMALVDLGEKLGVKVLDHLVIGGENNVSMLSRTRGVMKKGK